MTRAYKIKIWIYAILRLFIIGAGFIAFLKEDWLSFGLSVLIFLLTFATNIITRKLSIHYPNMFEVIAVIFIYAALYLGEAHSFYTKLWWWDVVLHMSASAVFGAIGFSLVYTLNKEKVSIALSPFFISFFAFTFSMMIGAIWEVLEYGMDTLLGFNMQKSGLKDTMWDLIVDMFGAFIVATIGYEYVKKGSDPLKDLAQRLSGKK